MTSLNTSASLAAYGSYLFGDPDPAALYSEFPDFLSALTALTNGVPENLTISDAIAAMDAEDGFKSVITVLFTNS
ncbi:unnamed protein product, partial [Mesorhabditis belari]|uniref:Uncharacterized protein n=1 Tax=Mesorhabditis belari TaxID=2138241 RepID=A0AAF3FBE4_9BILA